MPDYLIITLIMGQVSNIITDLKTGYVIMDCCIFGLLYILYKNVSLRDMKSRFYTLFSKKNNKQTVVLISYEEKRSVKFRAIMHYLAQQNKSIYKIREVTDTIWDSDIEDKIEKNSEYMVDQSKEFMLTPAIFGMITTNSKEKMRGFGTTEYIDYNILKIYSYTLPLVEIQDWINTVMKTYKQYLKTASNETQLYITASTAVVKKKNCENGGTNSSLHIEAVPWESTITFANSYFHEMDNVIKKIDFFLKNKTWYQDKGIPYNLGILLYGEPGCGKTRFIKQLMNYTGRHGIDIKLNDQMNFQDLYSIIFKEEINDDFIIPQNQRILIFEDIDAMGESVKCRDTKIKELNKKKEDENVKLNVLQELLKDGSANSCSDNESISSKKYNIIPSAPPPLINNNLSYLLNMFDGINECSGRIIIMTSNKPEVLDKALIRPGRIDIKIHFNNCTRYDVMRLVNLFWDLELSEEMLLPELDMKYTSAEIYNIFSSTNNFTEIEELFLVK